MLTVGLYEWKTTIVYTILIIMFKKILKTAEAEILKIFKNIQPQPKILDVFMKARVKPAGDSSKQRSTSPPCVTLQAESHIATKNVGGGGYSLYSDDRDDRRIF